MGLSSDRSSLIANRLKAIARSHVWWPGLDKALEDLVSSCFKCQAVRNSPPAAPLHPWCWPTRPWQRIHIDFAGPLSVLGIISVVLLWGVSMKANINPLHVHLKIKLRVNAMFSIFIFGN